MRCRAAGFRFNKIQREAQVTVAIHASWILHALHCDRCAVRDEAERLLALAGLTEDEFIEDVWDGIVQAAEGGVDHGPEA